MEGKKDGQQRGREVDIPDWREDILYINYTWSIADVTASMQFGIEGLLYLEIRAWFGGILDKGLAGFRFGMFY